MGKIVVLFESTELTQEKYDSIIAEMGDQDKPQYPRRPVHVAYQNGNNFCVIDVWNSQEELNDFFQNTLGPIFGKLGITPPPPQIFPIHRYVISGQEG